MRSTLRGIDALSDWVGKIMSWCIVGLVALIVVEVFLRYAAQKTLMWSTETDLLLGAAIYCAGWAYAHRHHAHVRIDILYSRLPPRGRATIDVIGILLLFIPLMTVLIYASAAHTWKSFVLGETSDISYWFPPIWPWRAIVLLGFLLLTLQGLAYLYRDAYLMIRNKPYD